MNEQLKSYKSVEQIAKKHRMDVSDIQKQLDMGAPIEHEHTNNQKLAVEIALQHLDEIPDYYTRLKKMEASAKKEHKKFKDVFENTDSLRYDWDTPVRERADRYCPKCEKLETRSECKYGSRYWDMFSLPAELISSKKDYNITMPHPANEEKDHEYSMARSELSIVMNAARRLRKKMKGEGNIEAWVQSKITKAADYIDTAADYIDSKESKVNEDVTIEDANGNTFLQIIDIIRADRLVKETKSGDQGLRDWFGKSKSSTGKSGWVQLGGKFAGEPCARQEGQTSTPKCGSSKMAADLSPEEEERARIRKNRLDSNQPQKSGGAKPTNVKTEETNIQEVKDKAGKGSGKKDACYNKVKSRYDVWPSAYASGALVKCRKVGADNWGTKSEDCWVGYTQKGMKKKGKKIVPNCVPVKEGISFDVGKPSRGAGALTSSAAAQLGQKAIDLQKKKAAAVSLPSTAGVKLADSYKLKSFDNFMIEASAAWQRKEGKNPEGGLNKKGIASYRKENPGSNLSLAVTTKPSELKKGSKSANRRKSFCSRSAGQMKMWPKAAKDPDSRLRLARKKWNC
jgi:hypothetical protein